MWLISFLYVCSLCSYPELRSMLCIGGLDMRAQLDVMKRGVHMVVATPGRLKDMLNKKRMTLDCCKYLCLDAGGSAD